jgi:hypothetical protein
MYMNYIIYKITNTKNKKIYIGKHQTENINDNYFGSGVALEKAIKKYGKDLFIKEILFIFDNEDEMNNKEKEIVTEKFIASRYNYNMGVGGEGGSHFKGKSHTKETKEKLSILAKGRKASIETKTKISEAGRKRIWSDETKQKISEKAKARFQNVENRKKHSELMTEYYKK